jgi:hypothetical protein
VYITAELYNLNQLISKFLKGGKEYKIQKKIEKGLWIGEKWQLKSVKNITNEPLVVNSLPNSLCVCVCV